MPAPLNTLSGIALPMLRDNIDTDALIPTSENTRMSAQGFGDALFAAWRYSDGPGHTPDPAFILNREPYSQAQILIAGSNFGCGSSRESAVWALRDYGFRVVIARSFNETFARNCIINGLAPLVMDSPDIDALTQAIERDPQRGVQVNICTGEVSIGATPCATFPVTLDPYYRRLLTSGQTENDLLREIQPQIDAHAQSMRQRAPWLAS